MPRHKNGGGQICVSSLPRPSEKHISDPRKILQAHILSHTVHGFNYQHDESKCHPQTRIVILNAVDEWACRGDTGKPILWLYGPAGAGKTTIANTLAERWSKRNSLAIKVTVPYTIHTDVVQRNLAATMADQLMSNLPATRDHITQAISRDPGLFESTFENQLQSLVLSPLNAVWEAGVLQNPVILIIDGLDEYNSVPELQHPYKGILETVLTRFPVESPLRCLVLSRNKNYTGVGVNESRSSFVEYIGLDSFNNEEDIEIFLKSILEGTLDQIPTPLADRLMLSLVKNAGNLFIYAGTAAWLLSNPNVDLERDIQVLSSITGRGSTPLANLDALYTHIMNACPPKSLPTIRSILEGLCFSSGLQSGDAYQRMFTGIEEQSVRFFEKLLLIPEGHLLKHLDALYPVLQIPPPYHAHDTPIRFLHISFQEFLVDHSRAGQSYICRFQALLNFQMHMIKHALIILSDTPPKTEYDEKAVIHLMLSGLADPECPPSKELRDGLNALIDADEQRYFDYLTSIGLENLGRGRRIRFSELITPIEELAVLRYLQKCNIPEIEPASWRRWMTSIYLAPQIALLGTAFR